mgnify:CR=1 FL=1|jgi:hypothetical protein
MRSVHDGIFFSDGEDLDAGDSGGAQVADKQFKASSVSGWCDVHRLVLCKTERARWFRRTVNPKST